MAEFRPFRVGELVTVWRAGKIHSLRRVEATLEGLVILDDDSDWYDIGRPVDQKYAGCVLAHTRDEDFDVIDKARLVGRVREAMAYLSWSTRLYDVPIERLVALEKMLTFACGDAIRATHADADGPSRAARIEASVATYQERLERAEQVELHGLPGLLGR